ncbi:TetR family transcriptional regulator [Yinghuangia aomiensis]
MAAATVELVVEMGWKDVRVEDICARAVVGRSTFFRYFEADGTLAASARVAGPSS